MIPFDGREHASFLDEKISSYLKNNLITGKLAIIQIGDNKASEKYVNLKAKLCGKFGIPVKVFALSEDESDETISARVGDIVNNSDISGVIIQLPFPRVSLNNVLDLIPSTKDIDVLSNKSLTQFYSGDFTKLSPVLRAFNEFLAATKAKISNLNVTVVGDGALVGKPVSFFCLHQGAKVTVMDNYATGNQLDCDLLVLCAGVPNLVNGQDIREHVHVADFGSSVVADKTVGDLNVDSMLDHLGLVSRSPGGMGPLVVRYLIMNFLGI